MNQQQGDRIDRFHWMILSAGGLGAMPIASGTWGSLPPVVLAFVLSIMLEQAWIIDACMILLCIGFSIGCIRFGHHAERVLGRKDPGEVVADEVAGQSIALLWIPWTIPGSEDGWFLQNAVLAASAFLLFRFFDILKPPPARGLQKMQGGWGILVDDLIAGAMAWLVLQVAFRLFLGW
ncbi:MAG: phosphatidylglycerophosphatase [Phycisphaerae bacterium]|nr:phosphatidylglycerophosphatase [Phycisphaerae bacterium]